MATSLTALERRAFRERFNLADGHARARSLLDAGLLQWALEQSVETREDPSIAESALLTEFARVLGQNRLMTRADTLILPTASLALELVANVCRLRNMSVVAPEPCFDNLIAILARHGVLAGSYRVDSFWDVPTLTPSRSLDAVLVVCPGNPIAEPFTHDQLKSIVEACSVNNLLLILDMTFRAYSPSLTSQDTYSLLEDADISYFIIEDTGKFLSTEELKASPLSFSPDLAPIARAVFDDLMISHAPFAMWLLAAVLKRSDDLPRDARSTALLNRQALMTTLDGRCRDLSVNATSVALIKVGEGEAATELLERWHTLGVEALPGEPFYWANPREGLGTVRVALMRDPDVFRTAMKQLSSQHA